VCIRVYCRVAQAFGRQAFVGAFRFGLCTAAQLIDCSGSLFCSLSVVEMSNPFSGLARAQRLALDTASCQAAVMPVHLCQTSVEAHLLSRARTHILHLPCGLFLLRHCALLQPNAEDQLVLLPPLQQTHLCSRLGDGSAPTGHENDCRVLLVV
jgi:hypothetical protein